MSWGTSVAGWRGELLGLGHASRLGGEVPFGWGTQWSAGRARALERSPRCCECSSGSCLQLILQARHSNGCTQCFSAGLQGTYASRRSAQAATCPLQAQRLLGCEASRGLLLRRRDRMPLLALGWPSTQLSFGKFNTPHMSRALALAQHARSFLLPLLARGSKGAASAGAAAQQPAHLCFQRRQPPLSC